MAYIKKPQHDFVETIKETEIKRRIDTRSIIPFVLTVGGTASVSKALTENPISISVVNIHATLEAKFTLTCTSTTDGSDFVMFNTVPVPPGTTLFLEGDEIALISKASEGYEYTFAITAASGTPSINVFIRT